MGREAEIVRNRAKADLWVGIVALDDLNHAADQGLGALRFLIGLLGGENGTNPLQIRGEAAAEVSFDLALGQAGGHDLKGLGNRLAGAAIGLLGADQQAIGQVGQIRHDLIVAILEQVSRDGLELRHGLLCVAVTTLLTKIFSAVEDT